MAITWFNEKEKEGIASFYNTNITLNIVASVPFEYAYRAQVGMNEKGDVVIQPLSKEKVLRGDLDEYSLYKIAYKKSYSRISSTPLMKKIAVLLNVSLSATPLKYNTFWDESQNLLVISTNGKEK